MTLRELYTLLEDCARQIPDIRTCVENDITRLNEMREAKYGVFGITQNEHFSDISTMSFSLNLFYIDRLVNSQDNEVEIQSHAIEMLRQIVNIASERGCYYTDVRYNSFTERFMDECAGAWAVVTFRFPISDCVEY